MKGIQKILALAVMAFMVCASVLIVSPTATVTAEDSAQAFAELNEGYPVSVLDQEQISYNSLVTVSSGYEIAQTFYSSMSGELIEVQVRLNEFGGASVIDLVCDIRPTILTFPDGPSSNMASETLTGINAIPYPGEWISIEFTSPPVLTSGLTYALCMNFNGINYEWDSQSGNPYGSGSAFDTVDGVNYFTIDGYDFCFRTIFEPANTGLSKVAWHGNNSYAYGVDGTSSKFYTFEKGTGTWTTSLEKEPGATFHDIVYDPYTYYFYIVGQDANGFAGGWLYNHDIGMTYALIDTNVDGAFYGVEYAASYEHPYLFLAVGEDTTNGKAYMCWYDNNSPWWAAEDTTPAEDATGDIIYDVTWNRMDGGTSEYYCVGEDASGNGVVYYIGGPLENGMDIGSAQTWNPISSLKAIDWHPTLDYALMVGENTASLGNAYIFNSAWDQPIAIVNTTDVFYDTDWHPDGSFATIVGERAENGVMYTYADGATYAVDMSSGLTGGGALNGVAMKGYSSPSSGLIVGASGAIGFYPSASDTGTTITVNAAFPHNFAIDMWKTSDAGMVSKLNAQVDVEETYTFFAEVNYTVSALDQFYADIDDNVRIELWAWYDELATPGVFPAVDDQHRTRAFAAIWMEGAGVGADIAGMMYPTASPGTDEFLMDSFWLDPSAPGDHYYIYMNITFGPQTWAADGGGFGGGASSNINNAGSSLNDADSWDFEMKIYDNNFPGATNSTYEEFGIFRFTNVTVSGNPGGNAPPGSSTVLNPNSQITCAANIDYYLNVSIPDLARMGGGGSIPATAISIATTSAFATDVNSGILGAPVPFPGANLNLSVWGNTSQPFADWVVDAPLNSTAAHGPQGEDFQILGPTFVQWWVNVPGATPEGVYQATITFKIGYH